jgi:hypothetical protein
LQRRRPAGSFAVAVVFDFAFAFASVAAACSYFLRPQRTK